MTKLQGFPGGPVVKTPFFRCMGTGLIPGQETRIPHATQRGQKTRNIKTHRNNKGENFRWPIIVSYIFVI